jgi:hypothetical protein
MILHMHHMPHPCPPHPRHALTPIPCHQQAHATCLGLGMSWGRCDDPQFGIDHGCVETESRQVHAQPQTCDLNL